MYQQITESYWSAQQAEVRPACVFIPSVDKEVSVLVLLSQLTGCPFAAKSGGHAVFAGASSSPGGITVLLRDLNEITLRPGRRVVSVGPGNTWGQVYRALEPNGLAAVGGRLSNIGVGGLITGGGISYHSNLYGWALDNVESFEVCVARMALESRKTHCQQVVSSTNGEIVTASESRHPDLYWALRGGGNNFGLVTRFNIYTIPSGALTGTTRTYSADRSSEVLRAFVDVASKARVNGRAQQYVIFARMGESNIISAELTYTENVSHPAVFDAYRAIPALSDSTRTRTLVEYCDDMAAQDQYGLREVFWNLSVALDEQFAQWIAEYFFSVISDLASPVGLVFQVITEPMLEKMSRAGGNALGLDVADGPILLLHILSMWDDAASDETIHQFINDFFNTVALEARRRGLHRDFIYMNYASAFQDVISSYGAINKAKLKSIALKYDPREVYQTLQPGYFKLMHAPTPNPF
jgi:hypothetical protein